MINPFLAGLAQAGADATQNIAASMAKSQELQRQQKEHDDEKTATIAKFYLDNGMVQAAAPHLKKLYGDQFDDKHLATLQAEADQKKKIANLDQLKTISDFTGHDAAKSQSLADSFGITVPKQNITSTAIKTIEKPMPDGVFGPGPAIHAPLTTTKTASLFDLMAKPKSTLTEVSAGASLYDPQLKQAVFTAPVPTRPTSTRLVQSYNGDGTTTLVPATPGATIRQKPAAAKTASRARSGGGHGGGGGSSKPREGWVLSADGKTKTWGVLKPGVVSHTAPRDERIATDADLRAQAAFDIGSPPSSLASSVEIAAYDARVKARFRALQAERNARSTSNNGQKSYGKYLKK